MYYRVYSIDWNQQMRTTNSLRGSGNRDSGSRYADMMRLSDSDESMLQGSYIHSIAVGRTPPPALVEVDVRVIHG